MWAMTVLQGACLAIYRTRCIVCILVAMSSYSSVIQQRHGI